jgi:hypothetical protein
MSTMCSLADLVDGLRLGHEAANHVGVARQLGVDRLHGHLLADDRVLGQIHDPHPALTKLGGDSCKLPIVWPISIMADVY